MDFNSRFTSCTRLLILNEVMYVLIIHTERHEDMGKPDLVQKSTSLFSPIMTDQFTTTLVSNINV